MTPEVSEEVRSTLRDVCLLGDDEATLPDGTHVGLGLLLVQWAELRESYEPELLLEIVRCVRRDPEEAPGKLEAFTLRWLTPARLSRLEGQAHKRLELRAALDPVQAAG